MTTFNSTYILSSSATRRELNLLHNIQLSGAMVGVLGQTATVVGTSGVDAVYARAGVSVDFLGSGASVDKLYLDGNYADYTVTVVGTVVTLTRAGSGSGATAIPESTYKLKHAGDATTDDQVIFANGGTTVAALVSSVASTPVIPSLDATLSSLSAPAILSTAASSTESARVRLDTQGTVVSAVTDPMLIVSGSSAVDTVYVAAGSKVDARGLGGSVDEIYLTGNWSDYTKTVSGRSITLTRTVGNQSESVIVSAGTGMLNDRLIFADGNTTTNAVLQAFTGLTTAAAIAAVALATVGNTGDAAVKTTLESLASATLTALSADSAVGTDWVTNQATQTVSGTYSGYLRAGDKIQVQNGVGAAWVDAVVTPTSATGGTFSLANVTLVSGSQVLAVRTVGLESNWGVSGSGYTNNTRLGNAKPAVLDTDGPSGALAANGLGLAADAWVNTSETTVNLEIATTDLQVGDTVQIRVAGANKGSPVTVSAADLAAGKVIVSVAKADLSEGANSITAVLSDLAGNTSTTPAYTLTLDTGVPTILTDALSTVELDGTTAFTGVANDGYLNKAETQSVLKITAATSGNTILKSGDVLKVYNASGTAVGTAHTVTPAESAAGVVYLAVNKADLAEGANSLTVKASDAAGNTTTGPTVISIVKDTEIPTPVLSVASIDANGAALTQDAVLGAQETSVVLVVEASTLGTAFKAGDVVTLVEVTSATGVTPVVSTPLLNASRVAYPSVTIAADGGKAYFTFNKAGLPTGFIVLQAKVNDVAANTADSGVLTLETGLTITNAAMVAGSVSALDVTGDIVLIASANLSATGTSGKLITFTNTSVTSGFAGENKVNTFTVDAGDTRYVTIDPLNPTRITIKPPFDFDFGNSYSITIEKDAFTSTNGAQKSQAVASADTLNFGTVAVGASFAAANQGQLLAADGTVSSTGKKWFSVEGMGTPGVPDSLDLAGGDYALVIKDRDPLGASPVRNDGVGVSGTNLDVVNWGTGDLIYVDDQNNDKTKINQKKDVLIYDSYVSDSATTSLHTVYFDAAGGTNNQAWININSVPTGSAALTETQLRTQLNTSNTRYGTSVTLARTDTSSTDPLLAGNNIQPGTPLTYKVSGGLHSGDVLNLVFYNASGQAVALTSPVTYTVNSTDAGRGFAEISTTSLAGLTHGGRYSVSVKVNDVDGAVTYSPAAELTYRTSVTQPTLNLATGQNDSTIDSSETSIQLFVSGATLNMGDKVVLQLGGSNITTTTSSTSTVTNGVVTVGANEINNGITFTVAKTALPNQTNAVTAKVTDSLGNISSSASHTVDVPDYVNISGIVGAGPIVTGNDLIAEAWDKDGKQIDQAVIPRREG